MDRLTGLLALLPLVSCTVARAAELPPNHPKIDGAATRTEQAELPPDHPRVAPGTSGRSADDILKQLDSTPDLKRRDKTFEIASAIGRLYYTHARYAEAAEYLGQADKKIDPVRAVYVEQRRRLPAAATGREEACGQLEHPTLDAHAAAARRLAASGNAKAASECVRAALEPALEVEELRGNALFLTADAAGALASYERVLAIVPDRANALQAHASVLFDSKGDDLKALRQAKEEWTRFLRVEPSSPKAPYVRKLIARADEAISAGGVTKLTQKNEAAARAKAPAAVASQAAPAAGGEPIAPLTPEVMESIKNTERTPELEQGLAKLVDEGEEHLAHQRYQEALDAYKRVMPFQPENGRVKAGMAWSLVGLQRQPMADRVWSVAVQSDPAAVEKLGDMLANKGDKTGAKAVWKKLSESAPSYAQRSGVSGKLK